MCFGVDYCERCLKGLSFTAHYDPGILGFPHRPIPPNLVMHDHERTPDGLVSQILAAMAIPECGLLSWFDREHRGRDLEGTQEDLFKFRAVFLPLIAGGIDLLPPKVVKRITEDWFRLIVWMGKDVVEESELKLTLVFAHELRHVEQFLYDPQLHFMSCLAREYLLYCLPPDERAKYRYFDIPVEHDAETRARAVAVSLQSEATVHARYEAEGTHEFRDPVPVLALDVVFERMRQWLADRIGGIREYLRRCDHVVGGIRDRASQVDWAHVCLSDPRQA